jgi:DUF1680 family protein
LFVIKLGSKEYKKVENNCVTIKRIWNDGEKLTIKFDIGLEEIKGGKSYSGKIALQRGPQVLALDQSLNQNIVNSSTDTTKNRVWAFNPNAKSSSELLPKQWIGRQAYSFTLSNKNKLVLVPFADASQTGAEIKVWMPLKPIE